MSKKKRQNTMYSAIYGLIYLLGFTILLNTKSGFTITNIIILIIVSTLIGKFFTRFVPDMRYKENKGKNPYTGLPTKNKKPSDSKTETKNKVTNNKTANKDISDKQYLIFLFTASYEEMDGYDFEYLCYLYFGSNGYKPELTKGSGDHGVDLIIIDPKDNLRIAVQCKKWKSPVGNEPILKLVGGKRFYKCIGTMCIATNYYTNKAKEIAEDTKTELWTIDTVEMKIGKWRKKMLEKKSLVTS